MQPSTTSTASVATLYDAIAETENTRLATHPMEREITLRTIRFHISQMQEVVTKGEGKGVPPRIADIGGGPGKLAFVLADEGYVVDLVDLSPGLVRLAEMEQDRRRQRGQKVCSPRHDHTEADDETDRGKENGILNSISVGNALDTPPSSSLMEGPYDAVLLLGPMYHLLEETERRVAFENALSLAKPGGVGLVFVAFVSVEAHLRDLAVREPSRLVKEKDFYDAYLGDGRYQRLNQTTGRKAQSFHIANNNSGGGDDDIRRFFEEHFADKAELVDIRSTEGILGGGLDRGLVGADEEVVGAWADLIFERFSKGERYLGCADHLLAVLRKK